MLPQIDNISLRDKFLHRSHKLRGAGGGKTPPTSPSPPTATNQVKVEVTKSPSMRGKLSRRGKSKLAKEALLVPEDQGGNGNLHHQQEQQQQQHGPTTSQVQHHGHGRGYGHSSESSLPMGDQVHALSPPPSQNKMPSERVQRRSSSANIPHHESLPEDEEVPAASSLVVGPPPFRNNGARNNVNAPLERNASNRQKKIKGKKSHQQQELASPQAQPSISSANKRRDSSKSVDDPPDHMEERARRIQQNMNMVSQQRSTSVLSTSSMPSMSAAPAPGKSNGYSGRISVPASPIPMAYVSQTQQHQYQQLYNQQQQQKQQFQKKEKKHQKKRAESAMSMQSLDVDSSPISRGKSSPLSMSCHVLLPSSKEGRGLHNMHTENNAFRLPPRGRQKSPHPADILKGQAAAAAELKKMKEESAAAMATASEHNMPKQFTNINSNESGDGSVPKFTIGNNLESSESAEELRQLIEAMQAEFQRLRSSKLQAEAKAEKLQTDLTLQQQEMEKHFESLSTENERLKSDADEANINLDRMAGKINQLENENNYLRGECAKLQKSKEVAEAKAVAADLRAGAVVEENMTMQNTMRVIMEKTLHGGSNNGSSSGGGSNGRGGGLRGGYLPSPTRSRRSKETSSLSRST